MTLRRNNNASIVEVECKGQKIEVQVTVNHENQPRAILGKCSAIGREKYYVWTAGNSYSKKPHLTCRITGWQENGTQQKPPQGTSVRFEDVRLDARFDGLLKVEVISIVARALGIYESEYMVIPKQLSVQQTKSTQDEQRPSSSDLKRDVEDLKKRVAELEERERVWRSQTIASPTWANLSMAASPTWTTSSNSTSPGSVVSQEAYSKHHFLDTVLCVPQNNRLACQAASEGPEANGYLQNLSHV